jgi:hypothetical protein
VLSTNALCNWSNAGVTLITAILVAVAHARAMLNGHTSCKDSNIILQYIICTLQCHTGLGVLGAPAITSDAVVRLNYDASVCAVLTAMANHTTSARIQGLG